MGQSRLLRQVPQQPRKKWMKELPEKRKHSKRPEQEEKELLQQLLPPLKSKLRLNFKPEEKRKLLSRPNSNMFGELVLLACLTLLLILKLKKKEEKIGSQLKIPSWVFSRKL